MSYLRGKAADPDEAHRRFGDLPFASESLDRVCQHLIANGIDLEQDRLVLGKLLEIDPDAERFRGDDLANLLLTREYREPYVVPVQV